MKIVCWILWLLMPTVVTGQTCNCNEDLRFLIHTYSNDYAGIQDFKKEAPNYDQVVDSLLRVAPVSTELVHCESLIDVYINYLDNGHVYFGRTVEHPDYERKSRSANQSPSLRLIDDKHAVITIPAADLHHLPTLDSLMKDHKRSLSQRSHLIIDVRGNGGGGDAMFRPLVAWLYSRPILKYGTALWTSKNNVEMFRQLLTNKNLPENTRSEISDIVARAESKPNSFVPLHSSIIDTLKLDSVYQFPEKVSVLIDGGCKSATEQFLLLAKQSQKVTVYGAENSGGALDYANLNTIITPSGYWYASVPTTRTTRLPDNPVDPMGISPDHLVNKDVDLLDYVLKINE